MTVDNQVAEFIERFVPGPDSPDPNKKDVWRIIDEPPSTGDCEDFALTVAYILAGRSTTRMRQKFEAGEFQLWFVRATTARSKDVGHAVLYVAGRGWMDNLDPAWRATTPHRKVHRYKADDIFDKLAGRTPRGRSNLRIAGFLLLAIGIILALLAQARAHDAASGWSYAAECCSGEDCGAARIGHVLPSPGGWRVRLEPGDHHHYPGALDMVVPYDSPAIWRSGDTEFHICLSESGALYCLYVPHLGG